MTQARTATATAFFIAVPGDPQGVGIYGIGTSAEAAVQDAYKQSDTCEPSVYLHEDGDWHVNTGTGKDATFLNEDEAQDHAEQKGFVASECTERLYRHIEAHGCDANHFSWTEDSRGLDDLDVDEALVAAAVAEVSEGFDGCTAQGTWRAESALKDAHHYVDAYVVDDDSVDEELRDALQGDRELRTAVDLAVRDLILAEIAEREAA